MKTEKIMKKKDDEVKMLKRNKEKYKKVKIKKLK